MLNLDAVSILNDEKRHISNEIEKLDAQIIGLSERIFANKMLKPLRQKFGLPGDDLGSLYRDLNMAVVLRRSNENMLKEIDTLLSRINEPEFQNQIKVIVDDIDQMVNPR